MTMCPLFRSHVRAWKLRLPWGWNTGELGPAEISSYGDILVAPVVFAPVKQHTGERVDAPLLASVYPGANGSSTLYEEDGTTLRSPQRGVDAPADRME